MKENEKKRIYIALTVLAILGLVFLVLLSSKNKETSAPISSQTEILKAEERAANSGVQTEIKTPSVFKKGSVPSFEIRTENSSITSESLKGKPTLIEFIATWCPYCQKTAPNIKKALGSSSANFIMVGAANESDQAVIDFHKQYGLPGQIGFDDDLKLIRQFAGTGYPTLVYLDSEGRFVSSSSGEASKKEIEDSLRRAGG